MAEEKTKEKMSAETLKQLFEKKAEENVFEFMAQEYVRMAREAYSEYLEDNPAIASVAVKATIGIQTLNFKEKEMVLDAVPKIIYDNSDEQFLWNRDVSKSLGDQMKVLNDAVPIIQVKPLCEALVNLGFEVVIHENRVFPIVVLHKQ